MPRGRPRSNKPTAGRPGRKPKSQTREKKNVEEEKLVHKSTRRVSKAPQRYSPSNSPERSPEKKTTNLKPKTPGKRGRGRPRKIQTPVRETSKISEQEESPQTEDNEKTSDLNQSQHDKEILDLEVFAPVSTTLSPKLLEMLPDPKEFLENLVKEAGIQYKKEGDDHIISGSLQALFKAQKAVDKTKEEILKKNKSYTNQAKEETLKKNESNTNQTDGLDTEEVEGQDPSGNHGDDIEDEGEKEVWEPREDEADSNDEEYEPPKEVKVKRKRGRPRKSEKRRESGIIGPQKKRGRKTIHNFEQVDPEKDLYKCYMCSYVSSLHGVRKHVQRHHGDTVECSICGALFGTKFDVRRHKKSHYRPDGTLKEEAHAWLKARGIAKEDIRDEVTNSQPPQDTVVTAQDAVITNMSEISVVVVDGTELHLKDEITVPANPDAEMKGETVPDGSTILSADITGNKEETLTCGHCNYTGSATELLTHVEQCHTEKFACNVCTREYPNQRELDLHKATHYDEDGHLKEPGKSYYCYNKVRRIICDICGFQTTEGCLDQHILRHHKNRSFKCDACDRMFSTLGDMRRHYTFMHHQDTEDNPRRRPGLRRIGPPDYNEPDFMCHICNRKLTCMVAFTQHMKVHNRTFKTCDQCDFKTVHRWKLNKHKKRNHGEPKHQCEYCARAFTIATELRHHIKTYHLLENQKTCRYCQKTFIDARCLNAHVHRIHLKTQRFFCRFCGKGFYNKGPMLDHEDTHNPPEQQNKKFKCSYCGKNFRKAAEVRQHENGHTGNRPYVCKICGRGYPWSSELNKHMVSHSTARPYKCTVCGKAFKLRHKLTTHMIVHTKLSKHVCPKCNKVFTLAATLKRHRCRSAQGDSFAFSGPERTNEAPLLMDDADDGALQIKEENLTVFMCGVCNQVFTDKEQINKHMYEHVDPSVTLLIQDEDGKIEQAVTGVVEGSVTSIMENVSLEPVCVTEQKEVQAAASALTNLSTEPAASEPKVIQGVLHDITQQVEPQINVELSSVEINNVEVREVPS